MNSAVRSVEASTGTFAAPGGPVSRSAVGGWLGVWPEARVRQPAVDARGRLQVRPGRVLGRHEEEEEVGRFAVERAEVDAGGAPAEGRDHALHPGELPVGDGDALAERGAVQAFAVLEGLHESLAIDLAMLAGHDARELTDDVALGPAGEHRHDHLLVQDVGNLHMIWGRLSAAPAR